MNITRRDGVDDTGEQDVRELRRMYSDIVDSTPVRPLTDEGPYVRDKEDVPHEASLADLYGAALPYEEDEVDATLRQMVEDGELIFGWIEERGELGYWYPEESDSASRPSVAPEPAPVSHRRARKPLAQKVLTGIAASVAAPFVIGVCAFAAEQGQHAAQPKPSVDSPDLTSNDIPVQEPPATNADTSNYEPQTTAPAKAPATTHARHAKASGHPEKPVERQHPGKHARDRKWHVPTSPSAVPSGAPTVKVPLPQPSQTSDQPRHHRGGDGPIEGVVRTVLAPLGSLLGD
jgi:hypothetical protein